MRILKTAIAASLVVFGAGAANAATVSADFDDSDCVGYFNSYEGAGNGFSACYIWANDNDEIIEISPVIVKYDESFGLDEVSSNFPSIDGDEFIIEGEGEKNLSGDWTYTPEGDDPGVRYWSIKNGNGFSLFWEVAETEVAVGGACAVDDTYTLDCLNAALVVTEGSWFIDDQQGLSHIVFYDSDPAEIIPLPAAGWLLLGGLGGLVAMRRRKS